MYALVTLWSIVGSWCFVRALRDGARRAWVGWALASVAGLATHYLYGPVLLAQAVFVTLRQARALGTRRLLVIGGATVALGMVCIALLGDEAAGVVARRRSFEWLSVPYTAFTFVAGFGLGPPVELLQRRPERRHPRRVLAGARRGHRRRPGADWASLRALQSLGAWASIWCCGCWFRRCPSSAAPGSRTARTRYGTSCRRCRRSSSWPRSASRVCPVDGDARARGITVLSAVSIARDRYDPRYAREVLRGAAQLAPRARRHRGAGGGQRVVHRLRAAPLRRRAPPGAADGSASADTGGRRAGVVPARARGRLARPQPDWEDDPSGELAGDRPPRPRRADRDPARGTDLPVHPG